MNSNGNIIAQLPQFEQKKFFLNFKKEPFLINKNKKLSDIKNDLSQDYRAISEEQKTTF